MMAAALLAVAATVWKPLLTSDKAPTTDRMARAASRLPAAIISLRPASTCALVAPRMSAAVTLMPTEPSVAWICATW